MNVRLARTAFPVLMIAIGGLAGGATGLARAQAPTDRSEKATRTAAQQKIDSQILQEIYRKRGQAAEKHVPEGPTLVRVDDKGRALVDIRIKVSADTLNLVKRRGGTVVSSSPRYDSIIARVPLLEIERLAAHAAVRAIMPAAEATTNPKTPEARSS
jgi:hypothetical protein